MFLYFLGWPYCSVFGCGGKQLNYRTWKKHLALDLDNLKSEDATRSPSHLGRDGSRIGDEPLFPGSTETVFKAVCGHMMQFVANHGMTKLAVSQSLLQHHRALPTENKLPTSYAEAMKLLEPYLVPLQRYEVCPSDCLIYKRYWNGPDYSQHTACPVCGEPCKVTPSSTEPRKRFVYMPIGPRLARWFGETNLAKLVQAGALELNSEIADFKDGTEYQAWFQDDGLLAGYGDGGIPLGLFTDGMNPNKNPALQRSM